MERSFAGRPFVWQLALAAAVCLAAPAPAALLAQTGSRAARAAGCTRIVFTGQANAGQEWKAAFGQGWVFRVAPIRGGNYSGWDLVVDREPPAGYPDALMLATPPYSSINEREVGTTFGLRAQDALGWNPRSFHFLTDPAAFRKAQDLFAELSRLGGPQSSAPTAGDAAAARRLQQRTGKLTRELMRINAHAAAGEFRILDARLAPGIADAAPYAEDWSLQSVKTPHSFDPASGAHPPGRGEFHWIKFSVTLWLPAGWKAPQGAQAAKAPCVE